MLVLMARSPSGHHFFHADGIVAATILESFDQFDHELFIARRVARNII
jgi:hypothetical protein